MVPRHKSDAYDLVPAEMTSTRRVGDGVEGLKIGERVGRAVGTPGTGISASTVGRNPCGAGVGCPVTAVGAAVGTGVGPCPT